MFLKTLCFIMFLTVSKIHFSKPNNATSAVSFERLELQTKKDKLLHETEWIEECKCVMISECLSDENDASIDIRIITKPDKCPTGKVYCCSDPSLENPLIMCGKVTSQNIDGIKINPDQAKFGEFPWQALILTNGNSFVSNGALIDNKHILSTAHFLTSFSKNFSALKVRLGDWDIYRDVEPRPHVERPVASIVIHPEYSPSNMHNDIAVITLSGAPVPVTDHVGPVCLPPRSPPDAVSPRRQWTGCRVSGWGAESFDRPRYPGVLKKVPVPLWDLQRCVESLRTTRLGATFKLHAGFLCAGGEENEDACKGDGGSPLVCEHDSVSHLIGLVSWGIGCGTPSIPGVYIDVSLYITWIEKQL
ncbi:phenoloxidase-activating factor 2-like [Metopolophium dirhodum]|uniref:phenoloxidase-activating factor 2-like n=1 Tax=Metopolophium dirhodum TaxID=44670 RepID=UPI00298F75B3|nr:phenoloxidase-activating factor 2-like [Metopolophium dirhodum]